MKCTDFVYTCVHFSGIINNDKNKGATILRFEVPVEQGSEIAILDDHGTVTYAYYDACITPSPAPTVDNDKYEVDFEKYRKDN